MNQCLPDRSGVPIRHRLRGAATAFVALMTALASPAIAGSVKITCTKAEADWMAGGPTTVTYDGDQSGTITIASAAINLSLPATKEVHSGTVFGKPFTTTRIDGRAEAEMVMPDQAALEDCAAKNTPADFAGDAGMFAIAISSCAKSAPLAPAPVKVGAMVAIVLIPSDDTVGVVITRTYREKTNAAGGATSLEASAGDCVLEGK